ncbi:MAG: family 43 glycosylhydrolase [Bryobacteraceae bacterium]|nr:family 43 glycosylhydrolase [Bryobacteraceae bacterium]
MTRRSWLAAALAAQTPAESGPVPRIAGDWVPIAGVPDLGRLATPKQEVVDFAIWEALDGSRQAWSCIRHTAEPGATRLFHRWEGRSPIEPGWEAMGIAMRADPAFGERQGSLQAPHVLKIEGKYWMFYSSGGRTFAALSEDGKTFARHQVEPGRFGLFERFATGEENVVGGGGRDIMMFRDSRRWIAYYTANPGNIGRVYARTSSDLKKWDQPRIVSWGGESGDNFYSAECPFVYRLPGTPWYFLFRTQVYRNTPMTRAYRSRDPFDFGLNDDRHLVARLPVAAPELFHFQGRLYLACLMPDLKGLRTAPLDFA